jgi:hypothetical protein
MQQPTVFSTFKSSIWEAHIRSSVFLAGAPRCGTTAFSRALANNPQICFSKPKETHFFTRIPPDRSTEELKEIYLCMFFRHLHTEHKVIADGSVSYLYSPDAIRKILEFDPNAKFIVMVRNPIDMIYSYYTRLLFTMDENVTDFPTAWNLQEARSRGEHIPKRCRDPRLLQYTAVGRLGEHVNKLLRTAGREKCFVIVFDDFVNDPIKVYQDVLNFIEVDYDGRTKLPQKNQNRSFKNTWLQQFVMNPPQILVRIIEKRQMQGKDWLAYLRPIRKYIKKINKVEIKRELLSEEMRQTLRATFVSDIDKLAGLLNRNFDHWR